MNTSDHTKEILDQWKEIRAELKSLVDNAVGHQTEMLFSFLQKQLTPMTERLDMIEAKQANCPARHAAESAKTELKQIMNGLWSVIKYGIILYLGQKLLRPEILEVLKNAIS